MVDNLCVITENVIILFESQKHHVIVKLNLHVQIHKAHEATPLLNWNIRALPCTCKSHLCK